MIWEEYACKGWRFNSTWEEYDLLVYIFNTTTAWFDHLKPSNSSFAHVKAFALDVNRTWKQSGCLVNGK